MTPPAEVLAPSLAFIIAVAVVGGLMRGFAGFGSALVMSPLISIIIGPAQTVAMLMITEVLVSAQLLPRALRSTDWRLIGLLCAAAAVTLPFGAYVLVHVDPEGLRRGIGLVVLVWALAMFVGVRYAGRLSARATLAIGGASGALMGATSLGGPPVLLYLLSTPARAESNRANIITYFALTSVYLIVVLMVSGVYTQATLWRAGLVAPFFLGAAWLGSRFFGRSSEALYRRVALLFLLAVGGVALLA